jgi:hypothetical protein
MLEAFESLHPRVGAALKATLDGLGTSDDKADAFLAEFLRNKTSKGQFAQELAGFLEKAKLPEDAVPKYIRDALSYLGVLS